MEILEGIQLEGIVGQHYSSEVLKKEICDRLLHIPNLDMLKGTIQMVQLVCNMLETLTAPGNRKKKNKLDKKQLALDILTKLFDLSPLEAGVAGKSIDYLIDSGAIRRAGKIKKSVHWLKLRVFKGKKNLFAEHQE